mmetsp:Transcript_59482/g.191387  ORF Transcript_59482/g.191387 Transcript_59482/m.191387 type:complete len:578 (-) Transcript_59482:138-1871(-)
MARPWRLLAALAAAAAALDPRDLQRAKAKVPRAAWKAPAFDSMSSTLNGHLRKMFPHTKPCSEWTAEELQGLQERLYSYRHGELDGIYAGTSDSRRMVFGSLEGHRQHWAQMNEHARLHPHLQEMHRDGHCHEAVMWLVHHVPAAEQQTTFARAAVPLLSAKRHACAAGAAGAPAELCRGYRAKISCADCHSGTGIIAQDFNDTAGVIPEDPEHPGWARQRRCDQNYLPACGPCEGVGGPYWGDKVAEFQPTNCEVVALPEAVPEAERTKPEFAEQFVIHQLGSDRLARTQNAAKFAFYSQVRSTLWYDFPLGGESAGTAEDGMAKLRHDTFYDDHLYSWLDHGLVSEIHLQSRAQREANVTGPMVSLLHGFLGLGKYLFGCSCVGDPVGVPVMGGVVDTLKVPHASFTRGADYKGRIRIGVEYDGFKLGDAGHGDMTRKRNMTVDHYVKWFLHLFVDADKDSPTYGQPVRFYGPYSGFAVYVKLEKKQPPAEVWDTACVENGWGTPEGSLFPCKGKKLSDYKCMNVEKKHPEVCKPYEGGAAAGAGNVDAEPFQGAFGSFPPGAALHEVVQGPAYI